MRIARYQQVLRAACVCGLIALAMMVWSIFDPRPLQVVGAMSVGQVLGTLSLAAFLFVVAADMRTKHLERAPRYSDEPPAP